MRADDGRSDGGIRRVHHAPGGRSVRDLAALR